MTILYVILLELGFLFEFHIEVFVGPFTLNPAACTERTAEDQYVQGTKRQACVYP